MMWVYVSHNGDDPGNASSGKYYYMTGIVNPAYDSASFKHFDNTNKVWKVSENGGSGTVWYPDSQGRYGGYMNDNDSWGLYRLSAMNRSVYGDSWSSRDGIGSKYTLRHDCNYYYIYDIAYSYKGIIPAGSIVEIKYGYGYTPSELNNFKNTAYDGTAHKSFSGWWDTSGHFHDVGGGKYYLLDPDFDYRPNDYKINTK
ncbi:hypothetical protein SAMN02982927_01281 [Sporolactobacillus nakayamae]|uniref:Uncharacterized protein n=2 Tax=Sporolactobacillus nakayamae TaxID=269670 RepID=A0A1I2QPQ2_9BACL|nr:hypothetical protein SAMN02982927_01281 [Sporolactobacillus nakayamae]